jgi:hypothetical protein
MLGMKERTAVGLELMLGNKLGSSVGIVERLGVNEGTAVGLVLMLGDKLGSSVGMLEVLGCADEDVLWLCERDGHVVIEGTAYVLGRADTLG